MKQNDGTPVMGNKGQGGDWLGEDREQPEGEETLVRGAREGTNEDQVQGRTHNDARMKPATLHPNLEKLIENCRPKT